MILFGFYLMSLRYQYSILVVIAITTLNKYLLFRVDAHLEGRWINKSTYQFIIECTSDLLQFTLYLVFFGMIEAACLVLYYLLL